MWAIRGGAPGRKYGGGGDDQLPARGALGAAVRELVDDGSVALAAGFQTRSVVDARRRASCSADGERELVADEVIAATGFRPDLALLARAAARPRRPRRGGPRAGAADRPEPALAAARSRRTASTSSSHPDAGVYIVGMKSYGRAPTFLLRTGYEQVRSVVAALAGDWEAARQRRAGAARDRRLQPRRRAGRRRPRRVLRQRLARAPSAACGGVSDATPESPGPAWRTRAWGIVGALSVTETVSWGILYYAFAAFLLPMQRELGFSAAQLTGAFSLALPCPRWPAIAVGRHLDRRSPRGADDRRFDRRRRARRRVVAGPRPGRVLCAVDRRSALVMAAVLYEPAFTVLAKHFPDAAERRRAMTAHDARRRARQLHLPAALAGADRRLRLARRAARPGGRSSPSIDRPAARAGPAPGARADAAEHADAVARGRRRAALAAVLAALGRVLARDAERRSR